MSDRTNEPLIEYRPLSEEELRRTGRAHRMPVMDRDKLAEKLRNLPPGLPEGENKIR